MAFHRAGIGFKQSEHGFFVKGLREPRIMVLFIQNYRHAMMDRAHELIRFGGYYGTGFYRFALFGCPWFINSSHAERFVVFKVDV